MTCSKRTFIALTAAALALALGAPLAPAPAYGESSASLQKKLDEVSEQLSALYSEAEQASYDLHTVQADLDAINEDITQTEYQIEEEQEQLSALQDELKILATKEYKSGAVDLLNLILNAENFDSLISRIRYAAKTAEYHQGVISQSKELQDSLAKKKKSLEEDRAEQEKLVSEQKSKSAAASQAAAEAQAYYDQLSDEMKAQIAAEEAAERERARQEAERQKQEAESNASNGSSSNNPSGGSSSGSGTSGGSGSAGGSGSGSGGGSHSTSGAAQNMVNRAWGIIGSGYSYSGYYWTGDPASSWFTCSGVVDYALGLRTNSNSPESLYRAVGSRLTTSTSNLAYGDLVFFRTGSRAVGHVGIYIGGGQMIDSCPGGGVQVRSLSYVGSFIGGGPIV